MKEGDTKITFQHRRKPMRPSGRLIQLPFMNSCCNSCPNAELPGIVPPATDKWRTNWPTILKRFMPPISVSSNWTMPIAEDNIFYSISPAEKTSFPDHQFDLITVGQALHWFDRDRFYEEVRRVGKPGGLLAVWGYALLSIEPTIDDKIMHFYNHIVGPYWDSARKLLEEEYTNDFLSL